MTGARRKIVGAVLVAALGTACAGTDPARESPGWAQDAALTSEVKSAIAADVGARAATIVNVETYNGTVQLTGFVDSPDEKRRAGEVAGRVEGVRSVKNDIRIKSPS